MSPRDLLLGWWLGALLGSTDLAGWYARTAHYIINWLFIILTTIHVYLSVTEDFPAFLDFFGLGFLDKRTRSRRRSRTRTNMQRSRRRRMLRLSTRSARHVRTHWVSRRFIVALGSGRR